MSFRLFSLVSRLVLRLIKAFIESIISSLLLVGVPYALETLELICVTNIIYIL